MAHVNSCTSPRVADNPGVSSVSLLSADSPIGEQVATGTHLRVEDSHLVNGLSQYVTWIKAVAPTPFLHLSLKHTLLSHSNTGAHVHLAATLQPKAVLSSLSSLIFQFLQCFFFFVSKQLFVAMLLRGKPGASGYKQLLVCRRAYVTWTGGPGALPTASPPCQHPVPTPSATTYPMAAVSCSLCQAMALSCAFVSFFLFRKLPNLIFLYEVSPDFSARHNSLCAITRLTHFH